jgi:GNAT superfamily N-acetyltransferase
MVGKMVREDGLYQLKYVPVNESSEVLSRAFFDDPLYSHIIPDEFDRGKLFPYIFKAYTLYCLHYGEVYASSAKLEGFSLWIPSDKCFITPELAKACKISIYFYRLGQQYLDRLAITEIPNKVHEELMDEPHMYLMVLGVDPEHQRKGFGSKLLIPKLKKLDALGMKCYLDTNKPGNVLFYQRHGFKVLREFKIGETGILNWSMVRDPIS